MAGVNEPRGLPLWSDYTRFLRRHRALIGALMGLGLVAGLVGGMLQSSAYSATASIALTPVPVYVSDSTTELVPPEVTIDTDAQLLGSPQVLGAIADELGIDPDAAASHLSVTASPNTSVLHVTLTASSPRLAAAAANAAVDALIEARRDSLGALQESELRQLRYILSLQERALAKDQAKELLTDDNDLLAQVLDLRERVDELEQASAEPANVISPAEPPRKPDYANTEVPVVSGLMLGLLLGCLVGMARDRIKPSARIKARADRSGEQPEANTHQGDYHHAV